VTGTPRGPHSPASGRAPESSPLRGPAGPSLPRRRGVASPITQRDYLAEAAAKAGELQAEVDKRVTAGDHKGAFNESIHALRAALAREARRRPADAIALYQYFTQQSIRLVRELPGLMAAEGDE
jgi:hypothetical protein